MLENLSKDLLGALGRLSGKGVLHTADVDDALALMRTALLEADVAIKVADSLLAKVREQATQESVLKAVSPADQVTKCLNDALLELLGEATEWRFPVARGSKTPAAIVLVGLQGSGKTTTSARLAHLLKQREQQDALLVSLDVYRPAAWDQLSQLAEKSGLQILPRKDGEPVLETVKRAMLAAKTRSLGAVIFDTAGRLQIDAQMMDEAKAVVAAAKPKEVFLVADALTGQDAVRVAAGFKEALDITGVILTRLDGDSRGGAALSLKAVTGAQVVFQGVGEGIKDFEPFDPKRLVSRLLGKGDVVALVEKARAESDEAEQEKMARRMMQGKFDLNDMAKQLSQLNKMGGVAEVMKLLPNMKKLDPSRVDESQVKRQLAIISSMTKKERRNPHLLQASRKRRVAAGSGTTPQDVNRLLKQYEMMSKAMKRVGKMGLKGLSGIFSGQGFGGKGMPPARF